MWCQTYNAQYGEIIKTFADQFSDQSSRTLEVKDKFHLTLLINKWHVQQRKNILKDKDYCHLQESYLTNIENSY